jgi:hypothetical protein
MIFKVGDVVKMGDQLAEVLSVINGDITVQFSDDSSSNVNVLFESGDCVCGCVSSLEEQLIIRPATKKETLEFCDNKIAYLERHMQATKQRIDKYKTM